MFLWRRPNGAVIVFRRVNEWKSEKFSGARASDLRGTVIPRAGLASLPAQTKESGRRNGVVGQGKAIGADA